MNSHPDAQTSRHYTSVLLENQKVSSGRKQAGIYRWKLLIGQDSDSYLLKTENKVSLSLSYWDNQLSSVKCLSTHFAGIVNNCSNKCIVTNAILAKQLPLSLCCHECMLLRSKHAAPWGSAGIELSHTDYRLQKFPYSQQNVLVASRRRALKTNTWKLCLFSGAIYSHSHNIRSSRQRWH